MLFPKPSRPLQGRWGRGMKGRVDRGRLEWPVSLVPLEQRAGEGTRQLLTRGQGGRGRQEKMERIREMRVAF